MIEMTGAVTAVRAGHQIDEVALAAYLATKLPGGTAQMTVRQFEGGQSNPTYLLETSSGRWVLRKKPNGPLLASAHMIEREQRVMKALRGSPVPVPTIPVFCEDASVIGTAFYVMDFVRGRIIRDPALGEMPAAERAPAYLAAVEALAALHDIDWAARGLSDYGKPANYVSRQIARWSRQYHDSNPPPLAAMDWLIAWLPEHVPPEQPVAIAHGDFRIDNLVLHPSEPRVLAVLDWELSTLGDPLTDLAYFCMPYHLSKQQRGLRGLAGYDLAAMQLPTENDVVAAYCARRKVAAPNAETWAFYLAFGLFRMGAILAGIAARVAQGNASGSNAADLALQVPSFAETARQIATGAG
jgi:aminoglycoside phosphotransferase (APT) family kinase protein